MKKVIFALVTVLSALTGLNAQKMDSAVHYPSYVGVDALGKSNTNTVMVGKSTIVRTVLVDSNRTVIITERFWKGRLKSKDFYVMDRNGSVTNTEGMARKTRNGRDYYLQGNTWVYWDGQRFVVTGGVGMQSYPRNNGNYSSPYSGRVNGGQIDMSAGNRSY